MDWTPTHVLSLEDRLTTVVNNDYAIAQENSYWDELMTERPSAGRKEDIEFLLTSADIHLLDRGTMKYDNLVRQSFELVQQEWGNGVKVSRWDFEDDQLDFAGQWAASMGSAMAMAPQYRMIDLLKGGETGLAYDGQPFFSAAHPTNPFDSAVGTFSNLLTACPLIDGNGDPIPGNLNRARAALRSFQMPNGRNRNLTPTLLIVPPELELAAITLTQAAFIKATENGYSDEFKAQINGRINIGTKVIVINELAGATDWYVAAAQGGSQLLPFIWGVRTPFFMNSFTGMTDVVLGQRNELEWQVRGRNVAIYGHPYQMVKCKA